MRLLSLISRFERNRKSGDPFGVPEMVQAGGSESTTTRFRLPPASRSSGRVKRLRKIADQMQPGLERDQPFARMIDAVPIGFALFAAPSRSGPNPDTDPPRSSRSRCHVRSIRLAEALSDRWQFCSVLIDRPKPNRLPVTEIRSPLNENSPRTQNALRAS